MVIKAAQNSNKRLRLGSSRSPIRTSHEITRRDQGQNSHNHKEPRKIEEVDEKLRETRDEWVISIKDKMEQVLRDDATTSWDKLCIYRVPHSLQKNDKNSYFPQTVSLGPYHYDEEHLRPMDHHKWRAVNMVMKRNKQGIEMYIDAMNELEERARACYEGPIGLSSNKFTEMLVLDGCFVLELFRGADEGFKEIGYASNDRVFVMRGLIHSIKRDMVMLENQLPLFVLDRLLGLQLGTPNQTGIVVELAVRFFKPLMPSSEALTESEIPLDLQKKTDELANNRGLHCLDIFHRSLFQSSETTNRGTPYEDMRMVDKQQQQLIHCVTELRDAGVKFMRKETGQLWDIEFKKGYLKIPKLLIHDGTKSLFLNLIAFEQCHTQSSNNITSYIIFMDNLINSSEDVSYLHRHGIIEHWLGSDSEVADLFNKLCKEVIFDPQDGYLSKLSGEVNDYYNRKWNYLKATLRHKYFSNPWAYFSFSAAVILLILTFFQCFFAAYEYFYPAS